ncbi:MAG: ATP:cob(I)alamin adenosyltransferase [Chitinophagaceae bacterium]|nr:ATP:cob(I)alamin adenosyltransferase [Chitinophagaceae bacterium]
MSQQIYTRRGDRGETQLVDGSRVLKNDLHIKAGASVDKLSSFVGLLNSNFQDENFDAFSLSIQNNLFNIGIHKINQVVVKEVEDQIDKLSKYLPEHMVLFRGFQVTLWVEPSNMDFWPD